METGHQFIVASNPLEGQRIKPRALGLLAEGFKHCAIDVFSIESTIMVLTFRTDISGQTVQTKIRPHLEVSKCFDEFLRVGIILPSNPQDIPAAPPTGENIDRCIAATLGAQIEVELGLVIQVSG